MSSGIHGRPYTTWPNQSWNKDNIKQADPTMTDQSQWQGFCAHSSILFLPWHRPYVALFEVRLYFISSRPLRLILNRLSFEDTCKLLPRSIQPKRVGMSTSKLQRPSGCRTGIGHCLLTLIMEYFLVTLLQMQNIISYFLRVGRSRNLQQILWLGTNLAALASMIAQSIRSVSFIRFVYMLSIPSSLYDKPVYIPVANVNTESQDERYHSMATS